jgi:hypothetical protein
MRHAFATLAAALIALGGSVMNASAQTLYPAAPQDPGVRLVESYYQRYLGRAADPGGLQGWVSVLGSVNVEAGILGSAEYYSRHGGTPAGFVTGLYVEVLGRQPAAAEVQVWLNRLQQVGWNRTVLADDFLRAATTELAQRGLPLPAYYQTVPQVVAPLQPQVVAPPQPAIYGTSWYDGGYPSWWGHRHWNRRTYGHQGGWHHHR